MVFVANGTPELRPLDGQCKRDRASPPADRRVPDVIAEWVHRRPDAVALRMAGLAGTEVWSYRRLWEQVCRIRDNAFGDLPTGSRVVMAQAGDADYVAGFIAAMDAGLIPVPLFMPAADASQRFLRRAQHILRDCEPAAVYTSAGLAETLEGEALPNGIALRTPDSSVTFARRAVAAGDVAFLQYTSGSTGEPKGIVNTHKSMLWQRTIGLALWNHPDDIRTVSWLPLYHDLGIFWGVLLALATGGTATVIPPFDFVRHPRIWLETVDEVRGNWIAGPDFAYRLCIDAFDDTSAKSLDLTCLRLAVNGAEPVRPATLRDFAAKFQPAGLRADVMAPQYGLAEAGLAVSGTTSPRPWVRASFDAEQLNRGRAVACSDEPADRRARTLVSCGDSTLGWDVRIVDPQLRVVLPDGTVGEIWVAGEGLPAGYWRRPDQTAEAFGAKTSDGGGPFLRTGDAGFRRDGELYICGRYRDLIIVGGGNYFPNDIELTVEETGCGVDNGGACAVQPEASAGQWWLVVETASPAEDLDDLSRILRRRILTAHRTAPERIIWVRQRALPRTTSGKIRRRKTLELLAASKLDVLQEISADPKHPVAVTELAGRVAALLGVTAGDLAGDTDLVTLGLTSVMVAQVVEWSAARSRRLDFAELYAEPTLDNWRRLYDAAATASSRLVGSDGSTTALQRAYWVGRGAEQPLGGVGCQTYFELGGADIDPTRLDAALDGLARRHPMLRSMFPDADRFHIAPRNIHAPLRTHDLTGTTDTDRNRHLTEVRARLRTHRFEIESGDTWRVELTRLDDRCILHCAIDLIIADLTSIGIFLRDLAALYRGDELTCAPNSFEAAARMPAPTRDDAELLPEGPQLPRVEERDVVFRREQHALSRDSIAGLDAACRAHGVTRAAAFLAVYSLVLQRWSTTPDFLINVTTFGRPPGVADVIGDFTQTHLYRTGGHAQAAFAEQVRNAQRGLRAALAGAESTDLLAAQLRAGHGHSGIAPVVFTYAADTTVLRHADAETLGTVGEVTSMTPQVIIDNQVGALGGDLIVSWDYRAGCFPGAVVTDMFAAYVGLLQRLGSHDWALPLSIELPKHSALARQRCNATTVPTPLGALYQAFREHARRNPAAVALCWAADEFGPGLHGDPIAAAHPHLTYGALDELARRVAGALAARHAPGSIIGIQLPKGPAQVVAVLGVLLSGCGYLPVGVDQPGERFARICALSAMAGLIRSAGQEHSAFTAGPIVHDIESMLRSAPAEPIPVDPHDIAYVIYTSGSTGEPKGVLISHAAALNTIVDVNRRNAIGATDVLLALSALDFDLSVYDIFGPLSRGASVVTISEAHRRDAFRWKALITEFSVTVWNSVPPLLDMLLIAVGDEPAALSTLRSVFLSGDWIPHDMARRLPGVAPQARLVAMGGATEAAIWSNEFVVADRDPEWVSVPYGYPLGNQVFRVVDNTGQDRPDHVAGELWIGGAGVALGYQSAPALTAEKFVADESGRRWYRTGDLGCYWPDGTLEFLGRIDAQVKINGHRVECGEIEHVLRGHPGVGSAVVVPIHGNRALGAVVVAECAAAEPSSAELRMHLESRLPQYMVPNLFLFGSTLPLNGNGKVDRRRAALDVEADAHAASHRQPSGALSPVEQRVAEVWSAVLDSPITNHDDNFFRRGGDSLRATQVARELKRKGVHGADVGQLLKRQTLREFSSVCVAGPLPDDAGEQSVATAVTEFPLTRLQQAYVLGSAGLNGTVCAPTYFAVVLEATEPADDIDPDRFAAVVSRCVDEFDLLRCTLDTDTGQRVHAHAGPVAVTMVAGLDPDSLMQRMAGATFDPRAVPAVQCFALTGSSRHIGLLINYLSLDARSLTTVIATIVADHQRAPRPFQVDCGATVFARFAGETPHNGYAHEHSPPPALPLCVDVGSGHNARVRFERFTSTIDPREFGCLRERASRLGVTPTALIFEAFGAALYATGADPRFAIVVPTSHRPDYAPADREVLGNFTRLMLCDLDYSVAEPGSQEAVSAAQEQLWCAVGDAGDATAYLAALRAAGSAGYPVVFTSTLGLVPQRSAPLSSLCTLTQTPGVWLDCQVEDHSGGARISWDVATGVISDEALAQGFSYFENAVRGGRLAEPVPDTEDCDWPTAVIATARRLCGTRQVRQEYAALLRHWGQVRNGFAAHQDTDRAARRLADILTGAASPQTLIGDPQLAPEALLLADERTQRALEELTERIFAHSRQVGRRLRIMEIGSRTGLITERLTGLIGAIVQEYLCFEPNPVQAAIAADRNMKSPVRQLNSHRQLAATEADVVVCCGSLHQLTDAGAVLDAVTVAEGGWLWVAEICEISTATLVSAAVLNPDLLSAGPLPAAHEWWRFLAQRHWQPAQMTQNGPGLTIIAHPRCQDRRPRAAPRSDVAPPPPPAGPVSVQAVDESVLATIAGIWQRHLNIAGSALPAADDDFFLLGGDSLVATRVYADLQSAGFTRLALVDLFNYPVLAELAERAGTPTPARQARQQSTITAGDESSYPLTVVQQAYLAGRFGGFMLSGVAAHCYFEFDVHEFDLMKFETAARQLIDRHPGLRTTVTRESSRWCAVVHPGPIEPVVRVYDDVRTPMRDQVIDLTARPGIDFGVQLCGSGRAIVGIGMDNIMLDGASMMIALAQLEYLYRGGGIDELPSLPTTFAHYVARHPELWPDADEDVLPRLADSRDYWRSRLPALPAAPPLAAMQELLDIEKPVFERVEATVGPSDWCRITEACRAERVTAASFLLAHYARVLGGWSDTDHFCVNVTLLDRDPDVPGIEQVIGDFTSLLLLECRVDATESIWELARRLQRQLFTDLPHRAADAVWLQRELLRHHGQPAKAVFPVVFTCGLGLTDTSLGTPLELGRLVFGLSQTPQTVLDFQMWEHAGGLSLSWDFVTQAIPPEAALHNLDTMVDGMLTAAIIPAAIDPDARYDELSDKVLRTCAATLGLPRVEPADNFFRLGGDSVTATRVVEQLSRDVSPAATLRLLFEHPVIGDFVTQLRTVADDAGPDFEEGVL